MSTISMAGVARLARVQRPVLSVWRSRTRDSDAPFPLRSPEVRRTRNDQQPDAIRLVMDQMEQMAPRYSQERVTG